MRSHPHADRAERAAHTIDVLRLLWGDELPPGQDPVQTVMTDAVHIDDEHGRAHDLIVQGDGLTLEVLHRLLRARGPLQDQLTLLPPHLIQRLSARIVEVSLDMARGSHLEWD
jgi:alkanesulfonate monooxygenase SsuD/methylene tetrahydromethanopterin reductase-like flavin-dependent oxidoreductase (luciferase family)